ncbi:Glycosyltransferase-like 1B [Mortierella claussenii]|nr:Glycosyltransferase-like 1B [Mortierella claussenii]
MDWPLHRRLRFLLRRKIRLFRVHFRLRLRRNVLIVLISTFILFQFISRATRHTNPVQERWHQLQKHATPGTLGAASNINLNSNEDVKVQLCSSDSVLCSSWGNERVWQGTELKKDEAWARHGWIKVPIGVQATVTMEDGRRRILRYGQHACDQIELKCQEIRTMAVQESIMSAIDRISEACSSEHWTTEPGITHTIRASKSFGKRDVSMIAQFSISRLNVFERARAAWDGPISVVIFLATNSDIVELRKYFELPGKLALYDTVSLTIVKPNYSLGTHKRYPINHLRNIGIQAASTDYIYVIDADFVPSTKLYNFAKTTLIRLLETATQPTAYVVPCLAIKVDYKGKYPDTIKELQPLMKSGMAYITDPRAGHGPTFTSIFMNPPIFGSTPAYEVCYESQWEPYYIVNRNAPHPYYDERFKNQGADKQSHALLMNAIGFRFMVLREHFMYHMDHPKLLWTGDGLDKDKQKDFTYFADYLPAMEKIFGSNYRWPRGCSRPFVQSFKRDLQGIGSM